MPRVLFVSYSFPPVGGGGVQRLTKWLKYLPEHGWDASVVTVQNPSVPVTDESLVSDVPAGTEVVRAKTLEPPYALKQSMARHVDRPLGLWRRLLRQASSVVLQPDPQILWVPWAVRAGRRILAKRPHEVVVATGPPFSSLLVGQSLARWAGLPLVLDFRDEWDLSSAYLENRPRDPMSRRIQSRMQIGLLRAASVVLATTRRSAAAIEAKARLCGATSPVLCIYNGYDADDFSTIPAPPNRNRKHLLAHVGTLWALTDAAPLIRGLRHLTATRPELAAQLEVLFAGRRTEGQSRLLEEARDDPFRVTVLDYLNHPRAVDIMRTADVLLLLLGDVPGAERVVPAKLFEYLAAGRPVVAVAPDGEVCDLLSDVPGARVCHPAEPSAVAEAIVGALGCADTRPDPAVRHFEPERYSRRSLTGELARILDGLGPAGHGLASEAPR